MHNGGLSRAAPGVYRSYFFAVVLLVLGSLVYLWGRVKTMHQGEELTQLRADRQTLIRRQDRLRAEVAGLKQSSRIHTIASRELGMVFPSGPPRNLYLKPEKTDAN